MRVVGARTKDHILFYEYFHGDNAAAPGASHQTGWTGMVAKLIEICGSTAKLRKRGKLAACSKIEATKPPLKARGL